MGMKTGTITRTLTVTAASALVALMVVGSVSAAQNGGWFDSHKLTPEKQEQHEQFQAVFEELGIEKGTRLTDEQHEILQNRMEELGIEKNFHGKSFGKWGKRGMSEEQQAEMMAMKEDMNAAIEAGDYDAWLALASQNEWHSAMTDVINEDNFARFAEAHRLISEGRDILEELGVENMGMQKGRHGIGMMK